MTTAIRPSIAADINAAHEAAIGAARSALDHARQCGELLSQVKAALHHGEWLPWLEANCIVSPRVAQGYMRIAAGWATLEAANAKRDSYLPVREALKMLAEPKDARGPERISDSSGSGRILIDPEFHALLPPLTDAEYTQLEKNIVADGCRNPLVVWNGLLLDGHQRIAICLKHGIPYRVVQVECRDRDEAMMWILRNQIGRKNLSELERAALSEK